MNRDWPGIAALVLAACLGLGWGGSIVLLSTPWTNDIPTDHAELLTGVGQVLAGALATFLGASIGRRQANRDRADLGVSSQRPRPPRRSPDEAPQPENGERMNP